MGPDQSVDILGAWGDGSPDKAGEHGADEKGFADLKDVRGGTDERAKNALDEQIRILDPCLLGWIVKIRCNDGELSRRGLCVSSFHLHTTCLGRGGGWVGFLILTTAGGENRATEVTRLRISMAASAK